MRPTTRFLARRMCVVPGFYQQMRFCSAAPPTPTPPPPPVTPNDGEKPSTKPSDAPGGPAAAAQTPPAQPDVLKVEIEPPTPTSASEAPRDPSSVPPPGSAEAPPTTPPPKPSAPVTPPPLPRGFEVFYDPIFPKHTDTRPEIAFAGIPPQETMLNASNDRAEQKRQRRSRLIMLGFAGSACLLLFVDVKKWFNRAQQMFSVVYDTSLSSIDHYEKVLALPPPVPSTPAGDESENAGTAVQHDTAYAESLTSLKSRTAAIFINLKNHTALHYDDEGMLLATSTFINVERFKAKISNWVHSYRSKEDPETTETRNVELYYIVPSYFPFAAIAFLWLLPFLAGVHRSLNGSLGNATKGAAKKMNKPTRFSLQTDVKTQLKDVAGLTEVKHEVTEIVDFLKNPVAYTGLGARVPRGVLIDGPPGVGKTLLAKAVAGEAKLPFISCSGSEFDEVYVGVGAKRVRELFATAKKNKPCVVFIDEIDTFGRKRRNDRSGSSRATINALLNELDGFHDASGIMVLAATNRADTLDDALTRSGRFDRKISVDLPPHKDRVEIAKVHLKPLALHPSLTIDAIAETLATMTPGCSGADIYNICNEAAITASRLAKESVDLECFYKAMDRIMIGMEKKAKKLTPGERERLAYHEAGHVVLTWFQETTDPVLKSTISPRGGKTSGVTKRLPVDRYISTQRMLREKMVSQLGGYVSEEFFFEDISSGAADDLRQVTDMAHHEVTTYGMAPKVVGHFGWQRDEYAIQKPYGEAKANTIDITVHEISEEVLKQARALLQTHLNHVRAIAGVLMKNETVTARELWLILGERPNMTKEFRQYLETAAN